MSPPTNTTRLSYDNEAKPDVQLVERVDEKAIDIENVIAPVYEDEADLKAKDQSNLDYSGFAQKTDPKEVKLVRKLDIRIMVRILLLPHVSVLPADFCLSFHCGPCTGSTTSTETPSPSRSVSLQERLEGAEFSRETREDRGRN